MPSRPTTTLLGPQRLRPTLADALRGRAPAVFQRDPELARAHRERQERMRRAQELYALRLACAMDCAYALLRRTDEEEPLGAERQDAIEAIRTLDAGHLERVRRIQREF